jgi:hypothetical protein
MKNPAKYKGNLFFSLNEIILIVGAPPAKQRYFDGRPYGRPAHDFEIYVPAAARIGGRKNQLFSIISFPFENKII